MKRMYEESLFQELIAKLKKQKIQRQYGSGRQRIDIVVQDKVPIEIKYNLQTTSEYHRTIGQLEELLNNWDQILLVLCGDGSADLLKSLEEYVRGKSSLYDDRIVLVTK